MWQLSCTEETVVRNKAVESLIKIAKQMKPDAVAGASSSILV